MRNRRTGGQGIYQGVGQGVVPDGGRYAVPGQVMGASRAGLDILDAAVKSGLAINEALAREYSLNERGRVEDALLGAEKEFEEWKASYRESNQGGNASRAMRDFAEKYEEIAGRTLEGFGGDGEIYRDELKRKLALRGLYAVKDGEQWQTAQTGAWRKSVFEGQLASFERMAREYPEDGQRLDMELAELARSWAENNPGLDPRAAVMKFEEIRDQGRIEGLMAREDYDAAEALLKGGANGFEGKAATGGLKPEHEALARKYARQHGVPEELGLAVIMQESGGNERALSGAGAIGLMQLMPQTARGLGVDAHDPEQNIEGGMRYLKQQYDAFGNWEHALMAYNGGPGRIKNYLNGWGAPLARETVEYAGKVRGRMGGASGGGGLPGLDAGKRAMWLNRIKRQRDEALDVSRYRFQARYRDFMTACEAGEDAQPPSDLEIDAIFKPEEAERIRRETRDLRQFAVDLQSMRLLDPGQAARMLEERKPAGGVEGFAEKWQRYEKLVMAVDRDLRERQEDGAAWLARHDQKVKAAREKLFSNLGPDSGMDYLAALAAGKKSRGMEGGNYLPKEDARRLAAMVEGADKPGIEAGKLAAMFGGEGDLVMREIFRDMAPMVSVAASGLLPDECADIVIKGMRDKDFYTAQENFLKARSLDRKDLQDSLMKKLGDFGATILSGGDKSMYRGVMDAAEMVAMEKISRGGMDMDDAIDFVADQFRDKYKFKTGVNGGMFRIPKAYDPDLVELGARRWLKDADLESLDLERKKELGKEANDKLLRSMLERQTNWVTAGDESGLIPFLGMDAILDKKGKPVIVKWEEMEGLGAAIKRELLERKLSAVGVQ